MRRHGWHLPYHPLQIVAVSIFLVLAFTFYVFFIPFVGSKVLEIALFVLYSPMVALVFGLYVWCVAVNPADDGVLRSSKTHNTSRSYSKMDEKIHFHHCLQFDKCLTKCDTELDKKGGTISHKSTETNQEISLWNRMQSSLLCSKSEPNFPLSEETTLYCSLCDVEISKDTKHCRICGKCIDGFDHHCRWLNNCIGRKNYKDFVGLLVSMIAMLIFQWSVGLWLVARYFLRISRFQSLIMLKLGTCFPSLAYLIIVVLCTLLSMAATYPFSQLFLFHIILIKKGISTYDYIVAMREKDQKGIDGTAHSPISPLGAVGSGTCGGISFLGIQGQTWCTTPRFLIDSEEDTAPQSYLSVKDLNSGIHLAAHQERKKPIKLNPWNLASLNAEEVLRLAAIAKKNSSILWPGPPPNVRVVLEDVNISMCSPPFSNVSINSIIEANIDLSHQSFVPMSNCEHRKVTVTSVYGSGSSDVVRGLNPLQMEAMNAFKTSWELSTDGITISSSRISHENSDSWSNNVDVVKVSQASDTPSKTLERE